MERTHNRKGRIARAGGAVVLAAGLVAGGIWGLGAATAQGAGGSPGSGSTPMTAAADPEQPAGAEKAAKTSVPTSLTNTGEYGENVYDAAKAGDWKTAGQKVAALKDSASQINAGSSQDRTALR